MLYTKKLNFFIVFMLILTASTIEAKRLKNDSDYFTILETNAKKLNSGLDELDKYMKEIYKTDSFMKNTFFGTKPAWYAPIDSNFRAITTDYPYIKSRDKKQYSKNIRNIVLNFQNREREIIDM